MPPRKASIAPWVLSLLGVVSLVCYGIIAVLSDHFLLFQKQAERPIVLVVVLFSLAHLLYLLAVYALYRWTRSHQNGLSVGMVIAFGVLFRLVQLTATPIQEIDLYRYLWDGQVTARGVNPFAYSPLAVVEGRTDATDQERLRRLREDPVIEQILHTVHHPEVPTVYPPLAQGVFALTAAFTPEGTSLQGHVLRLKLVLTLFDLGVVALLASLLKGLGHSPAWCLVYAWCPLVIKEVANSAHLDVIAVFFTVAMIVALSRNQSYLAASAWAAAILAKVYPIVLLPLAAWKWRQLALERGGEGFRSSTLRVWGGVIGPLALTGLLVVAVYLFCWPASVGDGTPFRGLQIFLTEWKMNDLLFDLAYRGGIEFLGMDRRSAFQTAYAVAGLLLALWLMFLTWQYARAKSGAPRFTPLLAWAGEESTSRDEVLCTSVFYALAGAFLLSPTCNPWYLLWAIPFLPWARQASWLLLPGLVFQYYLRFWFLYREGDGGAAFFDRWWVLIEYAPFWLALGGELLWRAKTARAHRQGSMGS